MMKGRVRGERQSWQAHLRWIEPGLSVKRWLLLLALGVLLFGLGGLLFDACRVTRLMQRGALSSPDLLTTLLNDAAEGFAAFAHSSPLELPAAQRLAFRELGLSIGLHGLELMRSIVDAAPGVFPADGPAGLLPQLERHLPLAGGIETFWRNPVNQKAGTWTGHLDINQVMLAASLVPEGFLEIGDSGRVD
ncbi:MAG: hypothetical protein ACOC15_01045 [Desulfovibrionales bacterium]